MSINKQDIFKYFLELITVAFGVFLGIAVSEWNAQRNTNNQVEKTVNYIVNELELNVKNLNHAIDYHEQLKTNLDSIGKSIDDSVLNAPYFSNEQFKIYEIPGWNGPGIAYLEKSVYEGAKMGNILQELDIKTLQLVSKTYGRQENYEMMGKSTLDKLLSMDTNTKTMDVLGIVEMLVFDVLGTEKRLKKYLEKTIVDLKQDGLEVLEKK